MVKNILQGSIHPLTFYRTLHRDYLQARTGKVSVLQCCSEDTTLLTPSLGGWEDKEELPCWQNRGNQGLDKSIHHPVRSCWIPAPCKLIFHKSCCGAQQNTEFGWKHWISESWALTVLQHLLEEPGQHEAWHSPHAKRHLGAVPGFS